MRSFFKYNLIILLLTLAGWSISADSRDDGQSVRLASLQTNTGSDYLEQKNRLDKVLNTLSARLESHPADYEAQLVNSILMFKSGDRNGALNVLDHLIEKAPDFHLAHLIRGDLLISNIQAVKKIGDNSYLQQLVTSEKVEVLENLRDEASTRLSNLPYQPYQKMLPREILALGDDVEIAVLIDKSRHRLYLYQRQRNGSLIMLRDYYVSTGKSKGNKIARGDLKTPEGVYFVTSFIPQNKLPDKYGVGAFPVNYPNELDLHLGKTGYGIWLHGTDSQSFSRPPQDSEGCVVLTNKDIKSIKPYIKPGITPVIISEQVTWLSHNEWLNERASLLSTLETWRSDWQSMDVEQYLSHYGKEFWSQGYTITSWVQRKRRVSKGKKFQTVNLSNISLLGYPLSATSTLVGESSSQGSIVVARFEQDYVSNNFNSKMKKRLYLKKQSSGWKIVYEGR